MPRLTSSQKYVFDTILAMFGKDIKKNISVLFTFADGQNPQALLPLQEAGVLETSSEYFKFNNSAFFENNSEEEQRGFAGKFWEMGMTNFDKFFKHVNNMEPKSLELLRREVSMERENLQNQVSALQEKIKIGIDTLSQMQQKKEIFWQHAEEINANKNFNYKVASTEKIKLIVKPGTYAANCPECQCTCHYPCNISEESKLRRCRVIRFIKGTCTVCPNRCHFSKHKCDPYRWETQCIEVEKEHGSKKLLYVKAKEGQSKAEALIEELQDKFNTTQKSVLFYISEMQRSIKRLSEIALKDDPLQETDYIDLLIQVEETHAEPGYLERLKALRTTRQHAEKIKEVAEGGSVSCFE